MSILENPKHFLLEYLTFVESISKTEGFHYFKKLGINVESETWDIDHSTFNWSKINPYFQFFYDYEGNEEEVCKWLNMSILKTYPYVILRLENEIIKVKTDEFINNWYVFVSSTAFLGFELSTEDGKYFLEFTDDWKFHLNSNFRIKP